MFEAAGLPANGGRLSETVHAADNMACRGEIASRWATSACREWYAELSEAEHYTWKQATRAVGPPPWGNGRTRQDLADAFLRRREFLLPKGARMLRKLDTARYPSGKQEARRKGERAEDAARAGAHGLVELGRGRRSRPAAAPAMSPATASEAGPRPSPAKRGSAGA